MSGFDLEHLGVIMEPERGNPLEVEGVLNPAAVRGPDGHLYVFPRLVAKGNYSRIGIARVLFDETGDPCGVERLGVALEPETDYELWPDGRGGCEDPRITFIEPLGQYVMTYSALSPKGPRIALAVSTDLLKWRRLGLASFTPHAGIEFDDVDNKDASVFPVPIPNPSGVMELAMLHRPLFPGTRPEETALHPVPRALRLHHESIWISYRSMEVDGTDPDGLCCFTSHHRLASPVSHWERLKIGGGAPPILTRHGWLIVYHGVSKVSEATDDKGALRYSAGVMVLSEEHPHDIRYRSTHPVLEPMLRQDPNGTIPNVVFPTGVDRRDDLGTPDRFDVYYGMADSSIGVARLDLPQILPLRAAADPPEAKV
ncbi:MAG: glycosidase [Actinomycetota bacterium]|nr:glycosidase [Actinomycetota bacterium]